jgi:uncharacterized protein (TIGR03067 family)
VLFVAGLLVAAAPRQDDPNKKALEQLQGAWKLESAQTAGKDVPPAEIEKMPLQFTFKGDKVTIEEKGRPMEGTLKLDATKKPATMDLTPAKGDFTVLAVYELEGDTLKLCFVKESKERPKSLDTTGTKASLLVFKRVTK